jgi:lipoyl(octanoyl) transferase
MLLSETIDWGRTGYEGARQRQEDRVGVRIDGQTPDALIFTEHDPVYTMGLRAGSESHLVWDESARAKEGVEIAKTNRGGDITYHGPGQIVGYPIVSLDRHRDLHAYLRLLEQVLIDSVATFGLKADCRAGKTGIWIGSRKIAAIGVAVRRWVAYHGFALNVNVNLHHFSGIVPCGIAAEDGTVTSMQAELGGNVDQEKVKAALANEFWKQFATFIQGE